MQSWKDLLWTSIRTDFQNLPNKAFESWSALTTLIHAHQAAVASLPRGVESSPRSARSVKWKVPFWRAEVDDMLVWIIHIIIFLGNLFAHRPCASSASTDNTLFQFTEYWI
jgi:hypothetical protein